MRLRRLAPLAPIALAALVAGAQGCIGNIGGDDEIPTLDESRPQACGFADAEVTVMPLRRLSGEQWIQTIRDLTGDSAFDAEVDTDEGNITERTVRQLRDASELVVMRRAEWTESVFPCDTTGNEDLACVDSFIDGFASMAFRHPVTAGEKQWLTDVYTGAKTEGSFEESMNVLLQVVLQSPQVVYMYERGVDSESDTRRLSDHEVATRLSYFLWNTTPDDSLLSAATAGELQGNDGLRAQAARLLDDPRAEATIQRFVSEWLQIDGGQLHHALEDVTKDETLYPEYSAELAADMRTELEAFVRRVYFEEGGSLADLLGANYAYVNSRLATIYGVDGPSDPNTWEWVDLPADERGGLMTRAAFLTVLSTKTVTAPIRRGVWVVEEALCNNLGTPPPNANDVEVEGNGSNGEQLSVRDDVIAKTAGNECVVCHNVINPVGFAFESYDALGRWQTEEVTSGLDVDSSGELIGSDIDGPVAGPVDMIDKLSSSTKVRGCFADRWTATALVAADVELDDCSATTIQQAFTETGNLRDLLLAIIESDAFRYVNVQESSPEEGQ
jgi:Protein of unknown function (DUF1592)/Protein of unknown function (DUF1588)/Protein of unknown function (DUF1595)/Protein of unknown function (DUF1585)